MWRPWMCTAVTPLEAVTGGDTSSSNAGASFGSPGASRPRGASPGKRPTLQDCVRWPERRFDVARKRIFSRRSVRRLDCARRRRAAAPRSVGARWAAVSTSSVFPKKTAEGATVVGQGERILGARAEDAGAYYSSKNDGFPECRPSVSPGACSPRIGPFRPAVKCLRERGSQQTNKAGGRTIQLPVRDARTYP